MAGDAPSFEAITCTGTDNESQQQKKLTDIKTQIRIIHYLQRFTNLKKIFYSNAFLTFFFNVFYLKRRCENDDD